MEFKNLGLAEPIVRAVTREGYTVPTPIQQQAIPHVLAASDLLGCAQTGTGKTAAFALPIIHRLSETSKGQSRKPRALILAPTRELASQIGESFRVYGHGMHLKHVTIFGGVNQNPQVRSLKAGIDIIVATPGRLMDLVNQRHVDLRGIEIFVLDEADRMLDMGFIPDIRRIVALIPTKRQTLLFSATMPREIRSLADSILNNPVSVQVDPVASTVKLVSQSVYHVPVKSKLALLRSILRGEASGRTLVFTRTKHGADKVVKDLTKNGLKAEAIHGNKSQNARTRALDAFKSHMPPVLVATDIASRGIDVDDITHVINFDMPIDAETYVHRIGRTARAGASGAAVSFCDREEQGKLRAIERLTGVRLTVRTDQPEFAAEAPAPKSAASRSESSGRSDRTRQFNAKSKPRRNEQRDTERTRAKRKSKKRSTSQSSSPSPHSPHASPGNAASRGSRQRFRDGEVLSASSNGRPGGKKQIRSIGKKARPTGRGRGGSGSSRW